MLLDFIVYIEESLLVSVVCHTIDDTLGDDPEIEGLLPSTHASILEAYVNTPNIETQVLNDNCFDSFEIALVLLILLDCFLGAFLQLFLTTIEFLTKLLHLLLFVGVALLLFSSSSC